MKKPQTRLHATVLGLIVSLFTTSFFYSPAEAIMMTLEPDNYAVGTNVTNLFEGVTLQRYFGVAGISTNYGDVYVESWPTPGSYAAATGTQTFGIFYDPTMAALCWSGRCGTSGDPFSVLLIQFDRPTNYVEIAASWLSDSPALIGFGIYGERVSNYYLSSLLRPNTSHPGPAGIYALGNLHDTVMFQTVLIGGILGNSNVDQIRYNRVPEPSSLLLLGVGLAGVAAWRKRQRL